jgi:phage gpG-like protein
MIALDMKIGGGKKGSVKLGKMTSQMKTNLRRGVDRATLILEREIKLNLSKGGAFRRTKGQPWIPNPGQHLRVGDDRLRSSWRSSPAKVVSGGVEGHVSTDVPYARIHEHGQDPIPKREYVAPAIKDKSKAMRDAIVKEAMRPLR